MDITSKVLREQHYNGVKHEKKVKFKLAELFREESSRPKKLKEDHFCPFLFASFAKEHNFWKIGVSKKAN